jgi:hypothetical protein
MRLVIRFKRNKMYTERVENFPPGTKYPMTKNSSMSLLGRLPSTKKLERLESNLT